MIFKTAEWGYGVKGAVKKNTWYGKRHTAVHNTQHKKHEKKQWKILLKNDWSTNLSIVKSILFVIFMGY